MERESWAQALVEIRRKLESSENGGDSLRKAFEILRQIVNRSRI